jgi:hypothetical protein
MPVVAGLRDFMFIGLVTNANTCSTGLLMLMLVSIFVMVHLLLMKMILIVWRKKPIGRRSGVGKRL